MTKKKYRHSGKLIVRWLTLGLACTDASLECWRSAGLLHISDEHVAGGVGGHPGKFGVGGGCLWGDATGPEDGDLARADFYGVALVGAVDVGDAQGGGIAPVDGGAVAMGEAVADEGCLNGLRGCHGAHGDDQGTGERAGGLTGDGGAVHGHIAALLDVADG